MRKPFQSPGRMKNSSYYIAPVGDRTHDLTHTVASNMVKVSHALNHSATILGRNIKYTFDFMIFLGGTSGFHYGQVNPLVRRTSRFFGEIRALSDLRVRFVNYNEMSEGSRCKPENV